MKLLVVSFALLVSASVFSGETLGQLAAKAPRPTRVGQVFIIGNEVTRDSVILRQAPVYPGQGLSYPDLRTAEHNLERLGIFKPGSVHVTAEDDPNNPDSEYKNVFVNVEETSTWSVRPMVGLSSRGEPVVSVVWEERNFDPFRWPTDRNDLMEGGAFRGAVKYSAWNCSRSPSYLSRFHAFSKSAASWLQLGA